MTAPGVLKNPVPVEALYDPEAARRLTLTNLLQREGYQNLDAVLEKGAEQGLRVAIRDLCDIFDIEVTADRARALSAMTRAQLDSVRAHIKRVRVWPEALPEALPVTDPRYTDPP